MKPIIYLAGPITGLSYAGAIGWREEATRLLGQFGIECADPMRGKSHLSNESQIKHTYIGDPNCTPRGIMTRDYFDVCRAQALLVNFAGATSMSAGTVMELGWAWHMGKPIVVIMEDAGNPHDGHPMILETISFRTSSFHEGVQLMRSLILPN